MGVRPLFLLLVGVFARVGLCIVLCLVGAGCWAGACVCGCCLFCMSGAADADMRLVCFFLCVAMNVCLGVFLRLK